MTIYMIYVSEGSFYKGGIVSLENALIFKMSKQIVYR